MFYTYYELFAEKASTRNKTHCNKISKIQIGFYLFFYHNKRFDKQKIDANSLQTLYSI